MRRILFILFISIGFASNSQIIPSDGLVAHWNFDNNTTDLSGNGNDGTLYGGINFKKDRFGTLGSAIRLLNHNQYMTFPAITLTDATISLWIKPDALPIPGDANLGSLNILGHSSTKASKRIGINSSNSILMERDVNGVQVIFTSPVLTNNSWHHVILVLEGNKLDLYLDGQLVSETFSTDPGTLTLNRIGTGSEVRPYTGRIDDVLIYDRALSTYEITQLMDVQTWQKNGNIAYYNGGNVGIGTSSPIAKLSVNGNIRANEVEILADINEVPDYVFADDYVLPTLDETEQYIEEHHHLPEIPSAKEISEEGLSLGEMNLLLLKKIEELTLHTIRQQKEINKLKDQLEKQDPE